MVPITNMPPPLWGNQNDRWQGYPPQREELLNHIIDADVRNVVFISGDTLTPDTRRFLESTGAPTVDKPFEAAQVRRAVQAVLRRA